MERITQFQDRRQAGQLLAEKLMAYANRQDVLVLGLPRGGVPVAFEVAKALKAPLDVFIVRKLGVPGQEELAMGAIAPGGVRVLNQRIIAQLDIPPKIIEEVEANERRELERRERLYRDDQPMPDMHNKIVILIDDGLATGSTMYAATSALRQYGVGYLLVAVPVGVPETCNSFKDYADKIVCGYTPSPFHGVGLWYRNFTQTTDDEVRNLLKEANQQVAARK